jgi:D-3-phosphoglycerate dehydrogenase
VKKYSVLVLAKFRREFYNRLKDDDFRIYHEIPKSPEMIDILVVRSKIMVNRDLVCQLPNLKCVITATHGKDHVDECYLLEKGIKFYTVPVQSEDIAQGVMGYIFTHATRLIEGNRSMKQYQWNKKKIIGVRIRSKTLGIIGYGTIGRYVEKLAHTLKMKVIIYDPYVKEITTSLLQLLEASDYITIHVPLNGETRHMIGEREINRMKDGAYLINTARGGIIDEKALLKALQEGKLAGAGLDVYEQKIPFQDDITKQLIKHPKVIATPHSIGQTIEALQEKGERVIKIIKHEREIYKNTSSK